LEKEEKRGIRFIEKPRLPLKVIRGFVIITTFFANLFSEFLLFNYEAVVLVRMTIIANPTTVKLMPSKPPFF
jgi:hypothetical protein